LKTSTFHALEQIEQIIDDLAEQADVVAKELFREEPNNGSGNR
jgi:hypothetical protein